MFESKDRMLIKFYRDKYVELLLKYDEEEAKDIIRQSVYKAVQKRRKNHEQEKQD